jgi:hypothetical protein
MDCRTSALYFVLVKIETVLTLNLREMISRRSSSFRKLFTSLVYLQAIHICFFLGTTHKIVELIILFFLD